MKRPSTSAQADFCDSCGAAVMVAGYDVLGDVYDTIVVDPIVLTKEALIACVVLDRPVYRVERRIYEVFLGRDLPGSDDRWMAPPDDRVAKHRCGLVFPGTMTAAFPGLLEVKIAYDNLPIPF